MLRLAKLLYHEGRVRIFERLLIRLANLWTISPSISLSSVKISILRLVGMEIPNPIFIDRGFNCWLPKNTKIGKCCSFGHNNSLWTFNPIIIGPFVQIAFGLTIGAGSYDVSSYELLGDQTVVIEGENWIGANVTIIGGVTIGRERSWQQMQLLRVISVLYHCGGGLRRLLKKEMRLNL